MKSLLVIALFLLSIVALVTTASRRARVAVVPVPIDSHPTRWGRSAPNLHRPGSTGLDLRAFERDLRFERTLSRH